MPIQFLDGKILFVDGQMAMHEDCCCVQFAQDWSFTDTGFIDGGQDGAYRAYDDPGDVPASPWSILNDGLSLRLDWEDDDNCRNHNPNTQSATATCQITVPRDTLMTVTWSGQGETQDSNFELMSLSVDGTLVGEAHAPGGGQGCAGMGAVVSDPEPPVVARRRPLTRHRQYPSSLGCQAREGRVPATPPRNRPHGPPLEAESVSRRPQPEQNAPRPNSIHVLRHEPRHLQLGTHQHRRQ